MAVLLAESKLDGSPLGTMRIQTNRFQPLAGLGVGHAHEHPVMGPAQFVTHCVTNWKSCKKSIR